MPIVTSVLHVPFWPSSTFDVSARYVGRWRHRVEFSGRSLDRQVYKVDRPRSLGHLTGGSPIKTAGGRIRRLVTWHRKRSRPK